MKRDASWDFLRTLRAPPAPAPAWTWLGPWMKTVAPVVAEVEGQLRRLLDEWDARLASLGGDPSRRDWTRFRPLRLSREEDWSDWLAHLLAESETGELARELFADGKGVKRAALARPTALREEWTEDGEFRADLVITWANGAVTHVEVKVGDENFEKTVETCKQLRRKRKFFKARSWADFILVLDDQEIAWDKCRTAYSIDTQIGTLLWGDVAGALRRCLWRARESGAWKAWAAAFCGAIEQTLLGHERLHAVMGSGPKMGGLHAMMTLVNHLDAGRKP